MAPQLGHGASIVYSDDHSWKPPNRMNGVNRARTKMELVMAKKMPPRGEAKKRTTSRPVARVGRMALI